MTGSEPLTRDPFTIIVGRGRSGTTLLRAMFDSHPSLAIPPESHFLVTLDRSARTFRGRGRFSIERFSAVLIAHWGFRGWGLDEEVVRSTLAAAQPTTYAEAYERLRAVCDRSRQDALRREDTDERAPHQEARPAVPGGRSSILSVMGATSRCPTETLTSARHRSVSRPCSGAASSCGSTPRTTVGTCPVSRGSL